MSITCNTGCAYDFLSDEVQCSSLWLIGVKILIAA